ncbi:hypothetical protein CSOJ01_08530 [Colletotrichum sojae]|uniref:Uncharacterized protein n=1 Tax=Colletotrichum sojae TaxID=2175907 RepID=A0A8H6J5V6_9PEZI|nr:hypothetical protein CSOJ01_08530 [Colletotrichum sojae]
MGHVGSTHEHSDVLNVLNSFPRLQNLALLGNFPLESPQAGELGHFDHAFEVITEKGKHLRRLSLPISDESYEEMQPLDESWYRRVREFLSALPMLDLVQFPCYDYGSTVFAARRTNGAVLELDDLPEGEEYDVGLEIEELRAADAFKSWPCGLRGLTADFDRPRRQGPAQY